MKDLGIDIPISGEKSPIAPLRQCVLVPPQGAGTAVCPRLAAFGLPARAATPGRHHQPCHRAHLSICGPERGLLPGGGHEQNYAVTHNDTMQAYASGMIRPLARVFDCTTFYGAENSATGFAYKSTTCSATMARTRQQRRRHARNWLRDNLPAGSTRPSSTPSVPSLDRTKAPTRTDTPL